MSQYRVSAADVLHMLPACRRKKKGSKRDVAAVIGNIGVHETQEKLTKRKQTTRRGQHRKLERAIKHCVFLSVSRAAVKSTLIKGRRARLRHLGGGGVTQCWHNLTEGHQRTHHASHCSIGSLECSSGSREPIVARCFASANHE